MSRSESVIRSSRSSPSTRPVVGWREWVGLPELGLSRIKAKIDTGAKTSALHAHSIVVVQRVGKLIAQFEVQIQPGRGGSRIHAEAEIVEFRDVKSSSGQVSKRPVIVTQLRILNELFPIEVTLASRATMSFRLLLGREAVRRRFVVDPGRSFYGGKS